MPQPIMDEDDYEFASRRQNPVPAQDTSTIAATIGVDVLQALVSMAKPRTHGEQVYFNIARNALFEATKDQPKPDKYAEQRPWDGPFNGEPSELDYETEDHCDLCNDLHRTNFKPKVLGTMIHARGATGRVCPVMFICHPCRDKS